MFRVLPVASLLAGAALLGACRKDRPEPKWDLDVVAPLIHTSLSIADLVPDSILSTDTAGNVSILYTAELFTLALDTVLTAPDTTFRYGYAIPFSGPVQFLPGASFDANEDVTRFDLEDLQLTRLVVRSGQLDLAITNMMNGTIIGRFSLPGAELNGTPFQIEMTLPPGTPANPSTIAGSRPLDGYAFDMRGPDHNAVNTLATSLTYMNSPDGATISITDQDSLLATVGYRDIVPEYATGAFGSRTIAVEPATTDLGLFANVAGTIDLAQVDARVKLRNGIGVDARARIHYIRSINTRNGSSVDLSAPIITGPVNITRAADLGNSALPSSTTIDLHQGNSNIEQFLENLPDQIGYALDVDINPLGDISNGHDFLYHDSKLHADLEVNIPLRLIATDLTLRKTIDADLPGTAARHAWRSGTLHLFAENGFPFSAAVQLAVVNATGEVLSVLGPGGTVAPGTLGQDGFVSAPSASRIDLEISADQMRLIHETGKVQVQAVFNTTGQSQHVQLLERYRMALQLTVDANYVVNGDE